MRKVDKTVALDTRSLRGDGFIQLISYYKSIVSELNSLSSDKKSIDDLCERIPSGPESMVSRTNVFGTLHRAILNSDPATRYFDDATIPQGQSLKDATYRYLHEERAIAYLNDILQLAIKAAERYEQGFRLPKYRIGMRIDRYGIESCIAEPGFTPQFYWRLDESRPIDVAHRQTKAQKESSDFKLALNAVYQMSYRGVMDESERLNYGQRKMIETLEKLRDDIKQRKHAIQETSPTDGRRQPVGKEETLVTPKYHRPNDDFRGNNSIILA